MGLIPLGSTLKPPEYGEERYVDYSIMRSATSKHSGICGFANAPELAGWIIKQKFIYHGSLTLEFHAHPTDEFFTWLRDCLKPVGLRVEYQPGGPGLLISNY